MPISKADGKKNGKQKYRVRINYTDGAGKHKQIERTAYGLEEAKQLERELNYQLTQETPTEKMTINKLAEEYLNAKKHEVRETSFDKTKRNLNLYVLNDIGETKLDKLTSPAIQKWKESMEARNLSTTTKKNAYGEFHTLLNYAVKLDYLPKNPLDKVGNFKSTMELKKEMDFYTSEEFQKFITTIKEIATEHEEDGDLYEWNYYVFFNIAFFTGMRKGEINALQWTDIKDGYLSITKSVAQKLKGEDRITPPKNRTSIRTLQIPLPLQIVLDEHYIRCQDIEGFTDEYKICGGLKALRDTSIQKRNDKYAKSAGVKTIRIHDFRHSHASLLANEGINIQEIARRLGHAKISMTWDTYSHLYPREEERAIQILNKIGDFSGIKK